MFRRILILLSFCTFLAGCSNTNRAYFDSIKLAFQQQDITASPEKIRNNKKRWKLSGGSEKHETFQKTNGQISRRHRKQILKRQQDTVNFGGKKKKT